jgi:hypothetical protein
MNESAKQLVPVLGQKREHAARRNQIPDHRPGVQQLPFGTRLTLHSKIIPANQASSPQTRRPPTELFSGVLAARRVWRTAEVRVTSNQDSIEHLVREEAMAPGSAGCYVAVCGRSVRAAALACPPGPRCPDCTAVRDANAGSERRGHRQRPPGLWAWLNLVRRRRHPAAGTTDGAFDAG